MFRKGNRWLAAGCIALILEAVAHTLGTLSPLPDDAQVQSAVGGMRAAALPMGLGMSPSLWDISRGLAFFMSIGLATLGALGLVVLAVAPTDRRLHRAITVVFFAASAMMMVVWWIYRIPPPLVSQMVVTALFAVALARGRSPQ